MIKVGDYIRGFGGDGEIIILKVTKLPSTGIVIKDTFLDYKVGSTHDNWRNFYEDVWEKIPHYNTPLWKVLNG